MLVCDDAETILSGLDTVGTWDAVIESEPALGVMLSGEQLDEALLAIANFVDLKSPYTLGHAHAVADLAGEAGARIGLSEQVPTLRCAGLVHDLGRLGVSNSIWDKRGSLGAGEWERVRMHPSIRHRAHAPPVQGSCSAGCDRRSAPRAYRWVGLSSRPLGHRHLAACADPRRRRRLPGDARAASLSAGSCSCSTMSVWWLTRVLFW